MQDTKVLFLPRKQTRAAVFWAGLLLFFALLFGGMIVVNTVTESVGLYVGTAVLFGYGWGRLHSFLSRKVTI